MRGEWVTQSKGSIWANSPVCFSLRNTSNLLLSLWNENRLFLFSSEVNKSLEKANSMIKMYPPYNSRGLHFLLNCLRISQQSRSHPTSCRAKSNHLSQVFFLFFFFHILYSTVLFQSSFVLFGCWSQSSLLLAIKAYEQTFSVPWKAKASPQSAHPTVPVSEVLSPVLKLEPEKLCQDFMLPGGLRWAGLYWFALVPLFSVS